MTPRTTDAESVAVRVARRVSELTAVVSTGVLVGSGVWLALYYRPGVSRQAGNRLYEQLGATWVHHVHIAATIALGTSLLLWLFLTVLEPRAGRTLALGGGLVSAVAFAVAIASGRGLRWYALALWAVKTNSDFHGTWRAAFDPVVRFVITSFGEVSPDSYRRQLVGHMLGSLALLVAGGLLGGSAQRRSTTRRTAERGS